MLKTYPLSKLSLKKVWFPKHLEGLRVEFHMYISFYL
jgi:hypothetical protein